MKFLEGSPSLGQTSLILRVSKVKDIIPVVAGREFDFRAFCELERMQAKIDNIDRLIDKKFCPSKPRPFRMCIWLKA